MTTPNDQEESDFEVELPGDPASEEAVSHDPEDIGASTLEDYYEELEGVKNEGPLQEESADEDDDQHNESSAEEEEDEGKDQEEPESTEDSEEEESDEADDEGGENPPPTTSSRFRFKSDEDQAVASIAKAKGISLLEAAEIFKGQKQDDDPEAGGDDAPEAEEPRTVATAREELLDLRRQHKEAMQNVELDDAAEIFEKIENLRDEIDDLKVTDASRAQQEEQKFNSQVTDSQNQAVRYYPDTTDASSALVKEMEAIDQRLKSTGNELFFDPDKPFKLAQMAANTLGIAPADPKAKPAKGRAAKGSRRPIHQPARGSARSASPATPTAKVDDDIDGIGSLDDYEEFVGAED